MTAQPTDPVASHQPTICAVCAWRKDCKKKYSYDASGPIKCADFTRDTSMAAQPEENQQ